MLVVTVARKPVRGSVVGNVRSHATGALHIDATRTPYEAEGTAASNPLLRKNRGLRMETGVDANPSSYALKREPAKITVNPAGRWPTNVVLIEGEVVRELDEQSADVGDDKVSRFFRRLRG